MSNFITKLLGIVIVLVLVVLMLANVMVADQLQARRSIVAEVTNFIDEVTDTGYLDDKGIQDLYLACNAYGPVCNVEILRYERVINPDNINGGTYTSYSATEEIRTWNQGDLCKVSVKEVGYTSLSYFLYTTLGLSMKPVSFSLTGRVR